VHADRDSGEVRTGLSLPPTDAGVAGAVGWPPAPLTQEGGACLDEQAKVEADLGVASVACPVVQRAPAPAVVDADADAPIAAVGFQILCYQLGTSVLVVEYTQTSTHCSHVVGLAVYSSQTSK
jgi:hypothetical protein